MTSTCSSTDGCRYVSCLQRDRYRRDGMRGYRGEEYGLMASELPLHSNKLKYIVMTGKEMTLFRLFVTPDTQVRQVLLTVFQQPAHFKPKYSKFTGILTTAGKVSRNRKNTTRSRPSPPPTGAFVSLTNRKVPVPLLHEPNFLGHG
jgi:hypothetical protein